MPNEYGQILLQQIEQQRQKRLRQRAEERGLPVTPGEQIWHSANAPLRGTGGGTACPDRTGGANNKGASVHVDSSTHTSLQEAHDPGVTSTTLREACQANASTGPTTASLHQQIPQQNTDAASALQSLLSLTPLLAHQLAPAPFPVGFLPAASLPSVVSASLVNQQPLLIQPSALLQSSLLPTNHHLHEQSQQLAGLQQPVLPMHGSERLPLEASWSHEASKKVIAECKEASNRVTTTPLGLVCNDLADDHNHQRTQNAKKQYQAALLQQMQQREEEREKEKAKKKKEDEEERIRLAREIESERIEKEKEESKQLSKSKQLAAANVEAIEPTLVQRRARQTAASSSGSDTAQHGRRSLVRSMSLQRDTEEFEHSLQDETIRFTVENARQQHETTATEEHKHPDDKTVRQPPLTALGDDRLLVLGLEGLKAEMRVQTEEMRLLQSQQRQVLQQMEYDNLLRNAWNAWERQRWRSDPVEYSSPQAALQSGSIHPTARISGDQRAFERQYDLLALLLKQAGISNAEDLMRRRIESGVLSVGYDTKPSEQESFKRGAYLGNPKISERAAQPLGQMPACADKTCGLPDRCPSKQPISRGLSRLSCCSVGHAPAEGIQPTHNDAPSSRNEGSLIENPEDRPLPTLLRRKQQHTYQDSHDSTVHQQRPQQQPEGVFLKCSPVKSATDSCVNSPNIELCPNLAVSERRQCCDTLQASGNKPTEVPAERRWRLNELWECVTHGFPPTDLRTSGGQPHDVDGGGPWYITNSWCSSECESELPCQTIRLPSGCYKSPVPKCQRRHYMACQINTKSKNGWFAASQMECLETSTAQTAISEEQSRLSQHQKDLYMPLLAKDAHGQPYEGVRAAQKTADRSANKGTCTNELLPAPHEVYQQKLHKLVVAEVDCKSRNAPVAEGPRSTTGYGSLCRALSVNAASLRLQQLHDLEDRIRREYDTSASPKERCLRQLETISSQRGAHKSQHHAASILHAQERFKSRLSWEADTAFPLDEGSRVQAHITQAHVKAFGNRPFAPPLQPSLSSAAQRGHHISNNPERLSPTPAKPPEKHALPPQHLNSATSATTSNKRRSRFSSFLGGMLMRNNSKTR